MARNVQNYSYSQRHRSELGVNMFEKADMKGDRCWSSWELYKIVFLRQPETLHGFNVPPPGDPQ